LADMGGKVYKMDLMYSKRETTPDLTPEKKKISIENTNKLIGIKVNEKRIKRLLERMGHNYNKGIVEIPAWRTDILHEVDLIEDVAIAYGYGNITPEMPKISTIGREDPKEAIKRKICNILAGLNMLETSNYYLTTEKDQFEKMAEKSQKESIKLNESKTDYIFLRRNLAHYALKIYSENTDEEYPQKIFELGKVFFLDGKVREQENLAATVSPGNFTEIKQITEYLFRMIGLKIAIREPGETPPYLIKERTAKVVYEGKEIGFIGEVHPKILKNWKIKMPVALLEISMDGIYKKLS
jgi:phenylalanyl-tRNA synthetase beta chain